jgi:DNA-binding CsgD family transcriptional regulator
MTTTVPGAGAVRIRGRKDERTAVLDLLAAAGEGRPGVLLLEGEPGSGKSLLLDEAVRAARERGLPTAAGGAWQPGRTPSMEPLTSALGGRDPFLGEAPVLVCLDDLQWADPGTLRAVRALAWRTGRHPVAWLLVRGAIRRGDPAGLLFDLMERDGARRCALTPLDDGTVTEIIIDTLGARPYPGLVALAAGAGGNAALLAELLTGLLEEDRVRITDGRARSASSRPPHRVRAAVGRRLDVLGPRTRHLVTVSAVMGRTFAPEHLAEILGTTPAAIVPELDEALVSGLLGATPDGLRFRHDLVWRVTAELLPPSVRRALHRQIGELLAERSDAAADAAFHLTRGARAGDAHALAGLDRAIDAMLSRSPGAAADLATHALSLTDTGEAERPVRTLTAVRALAADGRLDEAANLAQVAFTRPMPARTCARLRCLLAEALNMRGRPSEAAAEASTALAEPGLPGALRDDAELTLLTARAATGEDAWVRERATAVVSAADRHGDALVTGALTVLALAEWDAGRLNAGLRLAGEAVNRAPSTGAGRAHPRMVLAMLLADVRRLDEARTVMAGAGDEADPLGPIASAAAAMTVRVRIDLADGRFGEALTRVDAVTDGPVPHTLAASTLPVLATAALRAGDAKAAQRYLPDGGGALPGGGAGLAALPDGGAALAAAQITEARSGRESLQTSFGGLCEELLRHRRALVRDPAAAAWLVRTALALDDRPHARVVAAAAERLARANPAFPTTHAAARHARGVLDGDAAALSEAVAEHTDPWARASASEDLAVLAVSADRTNAVANLDAALTGYDAAGATRDAARVRRRLRRLGVRRRHWNRSDRPATGWESLTDTERTVSELVAQGLTNREVAEQLFMSTHTVAFHLRHIFRKLEVTSRVALTRLALEETA